MITRNGKPITNPFSMLVALCALAVGLVIMAFWLVLLPFFLMFAIMLHWPLWLAGRRGTLREGGKHVILDRTSFERS